MAESRVRSPDRFPRGDDGRAPGAARVRREPRIALYSHDTQGLGHIRRNLLITKALCRGGEKPVILLLSGVREASAFAMPPGVDCLTLPSLGKGTNGEYYPRSLGVSMEDLINVRSMAIAAALRSFRPDVLVVDKVPNGVFNELLPSLSDLRSRGGCRLVLGLREILDDPAVVRREWTAGGYESTIRAFYDRIWVYGDPAIYDTAREYGFPDDVASMVRYAGYLNPLDVSAPDDDRPPGVSPNGHVDGVDSCETGHDQPASRGEEHVVCLVGGGQDGVPLADAFLQAEVPGHGLLVTGPLMPGKARNDLKRAAASLPNMDVLEFVTDPCPLIERADRVIAMGGYNTICEVLAHGKPALIVPRTQPRIEQLIRASRFASRRLVDMLHPENLTPAVLSSWLGTPPHPPGALAGDILDFGGVGRLPSLLEEVMTGEAPEKERQHAAC